MATAEHMIQPLARRQSGRDDMKVLRSHYSGEGNTTSRIADAERACDSLHYKNEKSMPFSTFLDNLQRLFNTFKKEGDKITEPAKVQILLKNVEHPQLQNAVSALRIRAQMRTPLQNAKASICLTAESGLGTTRTGIQCQKRTRVRPCRQVRKTKLKVTSLTRRRRLS